MVPEFKNITVVIADRPYSLKIKQEEEELIRKMVDEVNKKINFFAQTYRQRDRQDSLSMALLTFAVEFAKSQSLELGVAHELFERLDTIDALLDGTLAD